MRDLRASLFDIIARDILVKIFIRTQYFYDYNLLFTSKEALSAHEVMPHILATGFGWIGRLFADAEQGRDGCRRA